MRSRSCPGLILKGRVCCHIEELLGFGPLVLIVASVGKILLILTVASWALLRIEITVRIEFIAKIYLY